MADNPYAKSSEQLTEESPKAANPYAKSAASAEGETKNYESSDYAKTTLAESKQDDSVWGGVKRGFEERALGVAQLELDMGAGHIIPQYIDGKIVFGMDPEQLQGTKEDMAKRQEQLEKEGEGTGVKGFLSETAGDPLNLIAGPEKLLGKGIMGLMGKAGLQGALSAFTEPTNDPNKTLGGRARDSAIAAPLAAATGGIIGKTGEKLLGKNLPANAADMTKPSAMYELAKTMGLKFTGKETPQEIQDAIQNAVKSKVGGLADKVSPGASNSSVWEVGTNLATSRTYGAALAKNDALYKKAESLGAKESIPVEGLADDIKSVIEHMESRATGESFNPKFGSTLNTLKDLHEDITNAVPDKESVIDRANRTLFGGEETTHTITGNQLVDLDQALNENFGRTKGKGSGGRALLQLQDKVQAAIQGMSPRFSQAYQAAKNDFRQNIVQNFRENPTLKKYWDEDDFHAMQALQKGIKLSPELRERATGVLDKIKTFNDLSELKKNLDPQTYDQLRAAKFVQLMNKAGLDASKLADEKNYAMVEKSLGDKPEDLAVLNAIKTFNDEMTRRGLEGKASPIELAESNSRKDMAFRTIFSFLTGHKVYGFRHLAELIKGKQPEAVKGRLTGFAEDASKGEPKPVYRPGVIPNVAAKVGATKEGKAVDGLTGSSEGEAPSGD